jgi:hypothetical protein
MAQMLAVWAKLAEKLDLAGPYLKGTTSTKGITGTIGIKTAAEKSLWYSWYI